jgi:sugar phosphate isomerase/epimerase
VTAAASLGPTDLVLCSGSLGEGPSWIEKVDAAARAGFDGVSIFVYEFVAAIESGLSAGQLRRALDDRGLRLAEVDGPVRWLPQHERDRADRRPLVDLDLVLEIADVLGARSINVLEPWFEPIASEPALDVAGECLAAVCDRAHPLGVLVHVEAYPWGGIADMSAAYEICRRAQRPNAGIVIDSWHLLRGSDAGRLPPDLPGEAVVSIQLSDAPAQREDDLADECRHRRLLPGEGAARPAAVLAELRRRGCSAPVGIEVFSDRLRAMDTVEAASVAFDAGVRMFSSAS